MKPIILIDRAASILSCFTPEKVELSAAEISREAGIPNTTVHRILAAFTQNGLLERNAGNGKYTIGPEMFILGNLYLQEKDLIKVAEPVTGVLNELTRENINVVVLHQGSVLRLIREESQHTVVANIHVGSVYRAYSSAVGRALISELTEAEIDSLHPEEKLEKITNKTISTKTELKLLLKQIRETGISFSSEGTFEGVDGFGALIRGAGGKAIAALGIALPTYRMNPQKYELFASLVKMGASLISYRLGHKDRVNPISSIEEICSWWTQNTRDISV